MLKALLGDPNARKLKKYQPLVTEAALYEEEIQLLSDDELKGKTAAFKEQLSQAKTYRQEQDILDEILPEAFAVVREAGKRVLGLRHYDVQLLGGIILHEGQIAEMRTGEGKTLVATLPAYLNALSGKGVHVVTVNDYLARRDAEWMGQVHRFLGLSVGLIQQGMSPAERRENYSCDITYTTNSELGFDYLRDNMATTIEEVVQRPFNYCVIDEVDSVLVDEARTPLIISGQVDRPGEKYLQAAEVAAQLQRSTTNPNTRDAALEDPDGDYEVDEKARNVLLTDEGFVRAEQLLGVPDLFDPENPWAHYIFNAIKAKELFVRDVSYIVRNDEVVIVDESTGRIMPGRRWSDGLHQAIEAKEHVEIQPETQTLASITYQNFFLLYPKLAGMTGTAKTEETEFEKTYKLEVTIIPTNRKVQRQDQPDVVYKTEAGDVKAIAEQAVAQIAEGRSVLIQTLSDDHIYGQTSINPETGNAQVVKPGIIHHLEANQVPFKVLNGARDNQTLGAAASWLKQPGQVLLTRDRLLKNDLLARAKDAAFIGIQGKWLQVARECQDMQQSGRPVLVGTTSVEKSEVLSDLLADLGVKHELLNAKPENVEREAEIVAQAGRSNAVTIATNMAGRGTDIILGGNADYMARLKVREYFMPRLVQPEDDALMAQPALVGSDRAQPEGFGGGKKKKTWKASPEIFPTDLPAALEAELKAAVDAAVKAYGAQSLPELEAEEKIAVAAEKAPIEDPVLQQLRGVYNKILEAYEAFTDAESERVLTAGGLHVIGTERHESRRVDNQLRGRAGRQGDPGSTRFFLSLEDNLLRIFGGDRVAGLMSAFKVEDDMPIESGMLTKSLEGAQKKVETYYYDLRKQVFEYDEVMNNQRRAIYAERRRVLEGQDLKEQVVKYAELTIDDIVEYYINPELPSEEWELAKLVSKTQEFIYLLQDLSAEQLEDLSVEEIKTFLYEQVRIAYDLKEAQVDQIKPGLMRQAERFFILQQIDTLWREHLQQMDGLRETVGLRGYGQKDPLIEYKTEGFELFFEMMTAIRRNVVYSMFEFQPQPQPVSREIEVETV
ncbi:MAG: preprotein translocase subunit SecA [Synechococcales cyanobacterium RM1_1_8]|nr:preprotein translocase subunit SecA [Synechococcales cyanobacterium RM1_1_8]